MHAMASKNPLAILIPVPIDQLGIYEPQSIIKSFDIKSFDIDLPDADLPDVINGFTFPLMQTLTFLDTNVIVMIINLKNRPLICAFIEQISSRFYIIGLGSESGVLWQVVACG